MASCFFVLRFTFITFVFLVVSLSNGEDPHYSACSFLYTCGNIKNVGYPFWGGNRSEFCGISDFKLSCHYNSTDQSSYTNMDVYVNQSIYSSVLNISTSSHTIVVSQKKLLDRCHLNNTMDERWLPTLKPDIAYMNISLFYGCDDSCVFRYQPKFLNCSDDDTNGKAYYFGKRRNITDIANLCSCKNNVTFAVNETELDELKDTKASLSTVLHDSQIVMQYEANFTACSQCVKSHGRCGSVNSPSSAQFVCYCRDGPQPLVCKSEKKLGIVLGLGIGGGIFVLVAIIIIWQCRKQNFCHSKLVTRRTSFDSTASELKLASLNFNVPIFPYSQLAEATHNFDQSKELGNGGFGVVYYGKLKDGREVAVKRLYENSCRRMGQFMNEIKLLAHLRHQNLVSLYGCTSKHSRELILVYEYVNNGTVADHLYGKNSNSGILTWPIRLRIAIETATALSYLHASDIIHRDVKTNNILLDSNFCVKVADFGLSRLFPTDVTHVSTAPQGTPGYLDPEYHLCYKLTDKSDVYSFGVVLIELISSLPAINMEREKLEINLANFAMTRIQRCAFDELVDPRLGFASDYKVQKMTILVAELAFQCLQHDREFRPSMDEVVEGLKRIEGSDYKALQVEEMRRNGEETVEMYRINQPPPWPTENDQVQLLSNHQVYPPSPISVIDKWTSKSSTSSNSKQGESFNFKQ